MVTEKSNHISNGTKNWDWDIFWNNVGALPVTNVNRALACQALNMLAICYLPGCIAAYIQLVRGTKYSRFPNFLDQWLKMRKYLGLLMLLTASIHVSELYQKLKFTLKEERGLKIFLNFSSQACISVADWEYHGEHKDHWRMECFLVAGL